MCKITWVTRQSGFYTYINLVFPVAIGMASPTEIDLKLRRLYRSITHLTCSFFLTCKTFERTLNLALILDGLARIAILAWDPNFMCFLDVLRQAGYAWNYFCSCLTAHTSNTYHYHSLSYVTNLLLIWQVEAWCDRLIRHMAWSCVFRWPLLTSHLLFLQVFW